MIKTARPEIALSVPLFGDSTGLYSARAFAATWQEVLSVYGDVDVMRLDTMPYHEERWDQWRQAINGAAGLMVASWDTAPLKLDGDMADHMVMAREAGKPVFTQENIRPDRLPFTDGRFVSREEWPDWVRCAGLTVIGNEVHKIREYLGTQGEQ